MFQKQALNAINNCESEFVLDEDLKLTKEEVEYVYGIVYYSTPLYAIAGLYETDEPNVYHISYFQEFSVGEEDENGVPSDINLVGEASPEEAKKTVDAFKDYVTETINNNLTADSMDAERAEVIYTQIIKDLTLKYSDNADAVYAHLFLQNA